MEVFTVVLGRTVADNVVFYLLLESLARFPFHRSPNYYNSIIPQQFFEKVACVYKMRYFVYYSSQRLLCQEKNVSVR